MTREAFEIQNRLLCIYHCGWFGGYFSGKLVEIGRFFGSYRKSRVVSRWEGINLKVILNNSGERSFIPPAEGWRRLDGRQTRSAGNAVEVLSGTCGGYYRELKPGKPTVVIGE